MQKSKTPIFYSAGNYRPEESVGYLMRQIMSNVGQEVDRQLAHTELTQAQWMPLYKIYTKNSTTVAELARDCLLDGGSTTRLLDRLESKGLCTRQRSAEDRRVVNVALTPSGQEAAADIPRILSGVQNAYLEGFSIEEFETLKGYLRRILANAQTVANQPPANTASTGDSDAT